MDYDQKLGVRIATELQNAGIETPMRGRSQRNSQGDIALYFGRILDLIGLDQEDDSLARTPERVAKMYCEEIFSGLNYVNFPKCTTIDNKMKADEMVWTKCTITSMCEHHFVPFIGHCHIAYIPSTKILGLSKFNRVANFFASRPQVQERLTLQIHAALEYILETHDVAVTMRCVHYCTHLRGVRDTQSETGTSKLTGKFMQVPELRSEFLSLTR